MQALKRARRRGGALMMVLMLLALFTVIGFALADACVFNLNLSRQYLNNARCNLLAQAAVQQFMVVFDQAEERARQGGIDLEHKQSVDLGLRALYEGRDALPDRSFPDDMRGKVTIDFDQSHDWHSTDNSMGEYPRASWLDRGALKSVPPFSVELLVSVDIDGALHHYRVLVGRQWPYAVYSTTGPVVLCGSPSEDGTAIVSPARIEGAVAVLDGTNASESVEVSPFFAPSGLTFVDPKIKEQRQAEQDLKERIRVARGLDAPCKAQIAGWVNVGPPLVVPQPTPTPGEALLPMRGLTGLSGEDDGDLDVTYIGLSRPAPPPTETLDESGNEVTGDAFMSAKGRTKVGVWHENHLGGTMRTDEFPAGLDTTHNPATEASFPLLTDYRALPKPEPPKRAKEGLLLNNNSGSPSPGNGADDGSALKEFAFLCHTLSLDPNQADDPPWTFGGTNRFVFNGSVGNHFVGTTRRPNAVDTALPPGGSVMPGASPSPTPDVAVIFESSGGIRLRDSILYVRGNLDLSARAGSGHEVAIEGSNSSLIVGGTLAISGGRLDARDQGMVILAREVVLRARGEYRGLIIATDRLTILPASNDGSEASSLTIRGAVLCGGPTVIRSTRLIQDPVYMKAVHGYGKSTCVEWRRID